MRRLTLTLLVFGFLGAAVILRSHPVVTAGRGQDSPSPLLDADGDGIPDDWEVNGVDIALPDGTKKHFNFTGASPKHKDIFVWVAWMENGPYTHRPRRNRDGFEAKALDRVVKAFADAPVVNLDGTKGINLHVIYADELLPRAVEHKNILGQSDGDRYDWTQFQALKKANFPSSPVSFGNAVHFALFAHQIGAGEDNCASGISRGIPGMDFIVALGCSGESDDAQNPDEQGNAEYQSGTFMHELGHNLGLHHGGGDDDNHKPNYVSVMNYMFQFSGIFRDGQQAQFDYSQFAIPLDERALTPTKGISQDPALKGYGSAHLCGPNWWDAHPIISLAKPVRWDCRNLDPEPGQIQFDANWDRYLRVLQGHQDWPVVQAMTPSQAGEGGLAVSPGGGAEADARWSALAPIVPVQGVKTSVVDGGILVEWKRIPLESVRTYEVFRQRPGGKVSRLSQTRKNSLLDDSAELGVAYTYQVGAVAVFPNQTVLDWVKTKITDTEEHLKSLGATNFGGAAKQALAYRIDLSEPVRAMKPK